MLTARSNLGSDYQIPSLVSFLIPSPVAQICFPRWTDPSLLILIAHLPLSASWRSGEEEKE